MNFRVERGATGWRLCWGQTSYAGITQYGRVACIGANKAEYDRWPEGLFERIRVAAKITLAFRRQVGEPTRFATFSDEKRKFLEEVALRLKADEPA